MSVEPLFGANPLDVATGPVRHKFVLLGGFGETDVRGEGENLLPQIEARYSGQFDVLRAVRDIHLQDGSIELHATTGAWCTPCSAVQPALRFLQRDFDPRGRIVIYGYSAGGFNTFDLCRAMLEHCPFWDTTLRQFTRTGTPDRCRAVKIDLLVVVDAAADRNPFSRYWSRAIPGNVRRALNFFETHSERNNGAPATAIRGVTNLTNTPVADVTHDTIDENTAPAASRAIVAEFLTPQPPPPPPTRSPLFG